MTTTIRVFKGDKLYDINFTLQDANGDPFDITGATLLFKAQRQKSSTLKFSGSMSIVSAAAGTCKYNVGATDFDDADKYYAEIQVTFGSGQVVTFGDIIINALSDIPR